MNIQSLQSHGSTLIRIDCCQFKQPLGSESPMPRREFEVVQETIHKLISSSRAGLSGFIYLSRTRTKWPLETRAQAFRNHVDRHTTSEPS